jgi:hypothetical protein
MPVFAPLLIACDSNYKNARAVVCLYAKYQVMLILS